MANTHYIQTRERRAYVPDYRHLDPGLKDTELTMRGLICVERMVSGRLEWLPLVNQSAYREWAGCFSLLGVKPC